LGLLTTGSGNGDMKQIWALAEVLAKFIEKIMSGISDPTFGLDECAPDVPAVVASLLATTCPLRSDKTTDSYLFQPSDSPRNSSQQHLL
jgi:hypothetical protein